MYMSVDWKNLTEFLVKVEKSSLFFGGEEFHSDDDSITLAYEEGEFRYETNAGSFDGTRTIFWYDGEKKMPVWRMYYSGRVSERGLGESLGFLPGSVMLESDALASTYAFLGKVNRQVSQTRPIRGPERYEEGQIAYSNRIRGDIRNFRGAEEILVGGIRVYHGIFHGGELL